MKLTSCTKTNYASYKYNVHSVKVVVINHHKVQILNKTQNHAKLIIC